MNHIDFAFTLEALILKIDEAFKELSSPEKTAETIEKLKLQLRDLGLAFKDKDKQLSRIEDDWKARVHEGNIEQKHIEEALRKSEEKYRDLVENINDIIYSIDANGLITYISPAVKYLSRI